MTTMMSYMSCHFTIRQHYAVPSERGHSTHNTSMSLRVCALLAVLLLTTHQAQARSSQRGGSGLLGLDQDPADSAYDLGDQHGSQEVASLMYQMFQRAAQEQQLEHRDEVEQESFPNPHEEMPMMDDAGINSDKRGSYMSLCHFKICNMGRKRTLRRPQWGRY